uniref:Uncharacterized protein n=2 Tax=Knipowitschia caucasica TaxID=637954 RepID=A0AAV2JYH1_KNICA
MITTGEFYEQSLETQDPQDSLRALMKERLTAATEVIFSLFERTIHEYEEELSRSKEETNRTQVLLDSVLHPRVKLLQAAETRSDPGLNHNPNQEIPGTSQMKEEQGVKQEEEHLPLPEFFAVCVKTEELSAYQQTEHKEIETLGEDVSTEPHLHPETEGDTSDDEEVWGAPFSCSDDENDSYQRSLPKAVD